MLYANINSRSDFIVFLQVAVTFIVNTAALTYTSIQSFRPFSVSYPNKSS